MPPKKGKDKDEPKKAEFQSLYRRREPLPQEEPPDTSEAEAAWKAGRNAFTVPLPEWDTEAVNTTEWKPTETEVLYMNDSFSAAALPEDFSQHVSGWRRASMVSELQATEEQAPSAQHIPEVEDAAPPAPDPKAKAKADPKAKAKAGAPVHHEPAAATRTTVQQFAECSYGGEVVVVSTAEYRSRELQLSHDDSAPAVTQAIASQFAIIAEHRRLIPRGYYLWELIYPQGEDGVPLFNPHGKYIVRLFVQGRWRQVLVDDVVPVGNANSGAASFAAVLPCSALPNVIWPQLLSKALLRAYQLDSSSVLPAITALTGWLPFRLPMTWDSIQRSVGTRPFVCLRSMSQVDLEVPAMGGMLSGSPMPKLVGQGAEALCEFLVCELEEEPRQVRLKAATWRPANGAARKAVLNAESEAEDEEEEEAQKLEGEELDELEDDDAENEEDDEDRGTQQSPSVGDQTALQSARSKEEGAGGTNEEGIGTEGGNTEVFEEPPAVPWVNPWPETLPPQMMLRSVLEEYHKELMGGYWVPYGMLEACSSFVTYMQPGTILKAVHDTTWSDGRKAPYAPPSLVILKLRLFPETEQRRKSSTPDLSEQQKPRGPPWHRAVLIYEPLRLNTVFSESEEVGHGPGNSVFSCLLQSVDEWQTSRPSTGPPPQGIHFSVSGGSDGGTGSNTAVQSVVLPPGEHWYLVQDDALHAGSAFSVYVEGTLLNLAQSSIEFVDAAKALGDHGAFVATLEQEEYPAHQGFAIWAKAELTLREDVASAAQRLQLISHLCDPSLWPYLQVTFLKLTEWDGSEPERRCAGWSVTQLMRTPLLQLTSLPLHQALPAAAAAGVSGEVSLVGSEGGSEHGMAAEQDGQGRSVKYIIMLEARAPFPVKAGNFKLQLLLPPRAEGWACKDEPPPPSEGEEDVDRATDPFRIRSLQADTVLRWTAETVPNHKGLVLRERLTVPMGGGDVTAMLRVTVSGLPQAFLCASLLAQLPPKEEFRPRGENGEPPPPLEPGAPVDPRDYNGRKNWLSSCRSVVEASGVEVVVFPHVILCEGSTYLFYVNLDPYKGPDKLEGGEWSLEIFGSGEVEAGADTMEQDLEELVRQSWVETPSDPPRAERAQASRRKWLIDHGLEAPPDPVEEEVEVEDPKAKKAKEAPKGKGAAPVPDEPVEDPAAKAAREAEELQAALERAEKRTHANVCIADFVRMHTKVEPVLDVEDPYTIVPDPPEDALAAAEAEEERRHDDEDRAEEAARRALGMLGLQELRKTELDASAARWETVFAEMESAKERNRTLLEDLSRWREEHATMKMEFMEEREALRSKLMVRVDKQAVLKDVFEQSADTTALQQALHEAEESGVGTWDGTLMETAGLKLHFLEAIAALKASVEKPLEELFPDTAAREAFIKSIAETKDLCKQLRERKAPLPADLGEEELLAQAKTLSQEPVPEAQPAS